MMHQQGRWLLSIGLSFFVTQIASAQNTKTISDSLVENLRCETLTEETVLQNMRSDAFAPQNEFPLQNWASGRGLAECWSLSHFQRLMFFMGRSGNFPQFDQDTYLQYLTQISDTARGYYDRHPRVFPVLNQKDLLQTLWNGFPTPMNQARYFRQDIEGYEDFRFYQPKNAQLILGDRQRPRADNRKLFKALIQGLAAGRKPLVVIRASLNVQHVVLVKSVQNSETGVAEFQVYDSNYPNKGNSFTYDLEKQEYYAPQVLRGFHVNKTKPVGVFLVDEDNMDHIQRALFRYYRATCLK